MRRATTWALTALTLTLFAPAAQAEGLRDVITQKTLDNGLTVIVIEDHSVPLVTVEIAVKNGAYTEPPEFNGLSHLYEHMFFKGNAVITTQEAYLQRIRELGISFNGTTSSERVNYYFTLPAKNLESGVVFMRDAITTATVEKMCIMKERYYVPNNSVLLIAGDVEPEAAFALAEREFAAWKPSAIPPAPANRSRTPG